MTPLYRKFPCASRHTTLQPVRNPGSMASIFWIPAGKPAAIDAGSPQIHRIASSSALFLPIRRNSFSMEGFSKRSKLSSIALTRLSPAARRGRGLMNSRSSPSTASGQFIDIDIHQQVAFFLSSPDGPGYDAKGKWAREFL